METTAAEEAPPLEADAPRRFRVTVSHPLAWSVAALLVLAATLVGFAVGRAPQLSPYDEWTHADYAWQAAHGHIPAAGSVLAPQVRDEFSCHGLAYPVALPPCGTPAPPSAYPSRGEDYNFGHPPLYYLLVGPLARVADAVLPGSNFITMARLAGALWLGAAMIVLMLAVRRFGLAWRYCVLGAALLPLCPGVLHASSTVTNDAPAPLAGAVALLLLARILAGERVGWLVPTAAATLATATKVLNGLPFLVLAVILAVLGIARLRQGDRGGGRLLLVTAVASCAVVLVVHEVWTLFQHGRGLAGWVSPIAGVSDRPIRGLPVGELLSTAFSGFPLTGGYYLQSSLDGLQVKLWSQALGVLVTAAPFMVLVALPRRTPQWIAAAGALGGVLAYPTIVQLQVYVLTRHYFLNVTHRYGLSMVPWVLACLMFAAASRRAAWLAAAGAAIGAIAMLTSVVGFP